MSPPPYNDAISALVSTTNNRMRMPIKSTIEILNDFKLIKANKPLYSPEQYILELQLLKYRLNVSLSSITISEQQMNTLIKVMETT